MLAYDRPYATDRRKSEVSFGKHADVGSQNQASCSAHVYQGFLNTIIEFDAVFL